MTDCKTSDLQILFKGLQDSMLAKLGAVRTAIGHPSIKGDISEFDWCKLLNDFFPARYSANKALVIDANGSISNQIDIVIFDRTDCPFLYNDSDSRIVPVESVCAIIEVKQSLNKANIEYAGSKAASVRCLKRNYTPTGSQEPAPVQAGLLTLSSDWKPAFGEPFASALSGLPKDNHLQFGCVLNDGGWGVAYGDKRVDYGPPEEALIGFCFYMLNFLQKSHAVRNIDFEKYADSYTVSALSLK